MSDEIETEVNNKKSKSANEENISADKEFGSDAYKKEADNDYGNPNKSTDNHNESTDNQNEINEHHNETYNIKISISTWASM